MNRATSSAPKTARLLVVATRPQNVVFSGLLAIGVATVSGSLAGGLRVYALLLCLYAIAAIYNNLSDIAVDKANKRRDNPFATGQLSQRTGYSWIAGNMLVAMVLQAFCPQPVTLLLTLAYLALLYAYSQPQLNLQARGFVAPVVLSLCYASLPYLFGVAQTRPLQAQDYLVAGLTVLLCTPLLLAKDYKDLAGDKAHGKRTPLVRYGARTVKIVSLMLAFCGCLATIAYSTAATSHEHAVLALLSGLCLAVYLYSVWYVHEKQIQRPRYFLRLPQAALVVLAGCLTAIG